MAQKSRLPFSGVPLSGSQSRVDFGSKPRSIVLRWMRFSKISREPQILRNPKTRVFGKKNGFGCLRDVLNPLAGLRRNHGEHNIIGCDKTKGADRKRDVLRISCLNVLA